GTVSNQDITDLFVTQFPDRTITTNQVKHIRDSYSKDDRYKPSASQNDVNNTRTTTRPGGPNANAGSSEPGLSLSSAPVRDAITGHLATATGQHRQLNENTLDRTTHFHPSFFEPPVNQKPNNQYLDPSQEPDDAYEHENENEALGPIYGYDLPTDEDSEKLHDHGPQDRHVQQYDDEQDEQADRCSPNHSPESIDDYEKLNETLGPVYGCDFPTDDEYQYELQNASHDHGP
ncbi:hypothetical protein GE09DRAFT_1183993, partial [Coniochaeta sp. 2T2.1]